MKAIVIIIFALAVCFFISRYVYLGNTAFALANIPVSWGACVFAGMCVIGSKMVRK